jgi:hypothetical protein
MLLTSHIGVECVAWGVFNLLASGVTVLLGTDGCGQDEAGSQQQEEHGRRFGHGDVCRPGL